jgi:hypothetical protein
MVKSGRSKLKPLAENPECMLLQPVEQWIFDHFVCWRARAQTKKLFAEAGH